MEWDSPQITAVIEKALEEDMGAGDITSRVLFPESAETTGAFVSRQQGVLAGLPLVLRIFRLLDPDVRVAEYLADGALLSPDSQICEVQGRIRALLSGERVALNFLQRLCGIATQTAEFVRMAGPCGISVLDTRKTTPLLRQLEKYAVRMGGGVNHRFGLYDAILVKDNHLQAFRDIDSLYRQFEEHGYSRSAVEVEVTSAQMLKDAIAAGGQWFLLDNMTPDQIRRCVALKKPGMKFEVSGGVTLSNFSSYLIQGIDFISIGALTHSVKSLDISLEFR